VKAHKPVRLEWVDHQEHNPRDRPEQIRQCSGNIRGKAGSRSSYWSGGYCSRNGTGDCARGSAGSGHALAGAASSARRATISQAGSTGLAKAHSLLSLTVLLAGRWIAQLAGNLCAATACGRGLPARPCCLGMQCTRCQRHCLYSCATASCLGWSALPGHALSAMTRNTTTPKDGFRAQAR
jgi:hypothetical protein